MLNATNLEHLSQDDCCLQCLCIYVVSCACLRVFGAVEGCLGANARRGHVIVSVITGNIFSRLAPIGPPIAKQSRSYFHGAVFWRQTYVVDICGGRICGLQCLAIASQHGGGWGRMGMSQLRYRYRSPPFWGWMGISQFHSAQLRYRYRSCDIPIRPQPPPCCDAIAKHCKPHILPPQISTT